MTHVDELIQRGRGQGYLSLPELRDALDKARVSPAEARSIIRELTEAGVQLGNEPSDSVDPAAAAVAEPRDFGLGRRRADLQHRQQPTKFAELGPQQGTDDMAIQKTHKSKGGDVRTGKETHAGRTAPDTVEISLDLTKFGIDKGLVNPELTVSSQSTAPSAATVGYAAQICHR